MLGLFSGELIFGGACYRKEFCISKCVWLVNKTASCNSLWAYIREGLLSEGYLHLRFGGLIFGRAYFFFGGGGGLIIGILRYSNIRFSFCDKLSGITKVSLSAISQGVWLWLIALSSTLITVNDLINAWGIY